MSSDVPERLRFMLVNAGRRDCVRLSLYSEKPNPMLVSVNGRVVSPSNILIDSKGRLRQKIEEKPGQFMPAPNGRNNGENYYSRVQNTIYWTQCGNASIVITRKDVVYVSLRLPAMTEEEFYGKNIIENLAAFLNIPPSKVRVASIVTNKSSRRKRDLSSVTAENSDECENAGTKTLLEVGDTQNNCTDSDENGEGNCGSDIDTTQIKAKLDAKIKNNSSESIFRTKVCAVTVTNGTSDTSREPVPLRKIQKLVIHTEPGNGTKETLPLSTQPKLYFEHINGSRLEYVGTDVYYWKVEVSIESGTNAQAELLGNTLVPVIDGWANFSDIAISTEGEYTLRFGVLKPKRASRLKTTSAKVVILKRRVAAVAKVASPDILVDYPFKIDVQLKDVDDGSTIKDVSRFGLNWTATVSAYEDGLFNYELNGNLIKQFETDAAHFVNLVVNKAGKYPIKVLVQSDNKGHTLETEVFVSLMTQEQSQSELDESYSLKLVFPIPYEEGRAEYLAALLWNEYTNSRYFRMLSESHDGDKSTTSVTFTAEASTGSFQDAQLQVCGVAKKKILIKLGETSTYIPDEYTVDGITYKGEGKTCRSIVEEILKRNKPADESAACYRLRGWCYKVLDSGLSWNNAQDLCHSKNGYLAEIRTQIEDGFLNGLLSKRDKYWIGAGLDESDGNFVWQESQVSLLGGYTNWVSQPDSEQQTADEENCVGKGYIDGKSRWDRYLCKQNRKPLCQIPRSVCTEEGSCYIVFPDRTDRATAKARCESAGYFLAEINSEEEENFLTSIIETANEHYWLGGYFYRQLYWWEQTGVKIKRQQFKNWQNGEPNYSLAGNCMTLSKEKDGDGYYWSDASCTEIYPGICEKSTSVPP